MPTKTKILFKEKSASFFVNIQFEMPRMRISNMLERNEDLPARKTNQRIQLQVERNKALPTRKTNQRIWLQENRKVQ